MTKTNFSRIIKLTVFITVVFFCRISLAGTIENLGVPVKNSGVMFYMVGPDAIGESNMIYVNFNGPTLGGSPLFLVQIDPRTGKVNQYNAPKGNPGAWGFIVGPDKKIYLGTHGGGNLLCFDPKQPQKGLHLIGKLSQTESHINMLANGNDGKIYAGTHPGGKLVSYDTATGKINDIGSFGDGLTAARCLATGKNGWIYVGMGWKAQVVAYNPATGKHHHVFTEQQCQDKRLGVAFNGPDGHAYALFRPDDDSKAKYRLEDGKAIAIDPATAPVWDSPMPSVSVQNPHAKIMTLANGKVLRDVNLRGTYTLYEPKSKTEKKYKFEYEGNGSSIFVVGEGPGGMIYGSTIIPQELFSYDPATGKMVDYGNPGPIGTGEIYSFATWNNKLYCCGYPGGFLSIYDPQKSWDYGTDPNNNPYLVVGKYGFGKGHLRPRAMILGPDDKIFVGSAAGYGVVGGAMAVFNPKTNKYVNYREPFTSPGHGIASLAYDPESGLVFGGNNIGEMFLWHPAEGKMLKKFKPVAEHSNIPSMCIVDGKLFFTCLDWKGSNKIGVYDIASQKVIHQADLTSRPLEISLGLHSDGLIYGLTTTDIFSINPKNYQMRKLAALPKDTFCGWAITKDGIYFGAGTHLWRYNW